MIHRRTLGWVLGIVLLAAGGISLFLHLYDLVEVELERPLQGEPARNDYYAAELLFERMGITTERQLLVRELPSTQHVVAFLEAPEALQAWDSKRVSAWVEQGGHLLIAPGITRRGLREWREMSDIESDEEFGLADYLEEILEGTPFADLGLGIDADHCPGASSSTVEVTLEGAPLQVEINACPLLDPDGKAEFATGSFPEGEAASLLRYRMGDGLLTVLADPSPLHNFRIGEADHAAFAWEVIAPRSHPPAGVLLVRSAYSNMPSLAQVLARHAWPALTSGALALLLFFWSRGARFGPIRQARSGERRSLLEHVQATGSFLWSQRLAEVLLESTRTALDRAARRRLPGYGSLNRMERSRWLAERAGSTAGAMASAMAPRSIEEPADITKEMRTLEAARKALSGSLASGERISPPSAPS